MTTKQVLDSIYIIPVIIEHLEKPTSLTAKILMEYDIDIGRMKRLESLLQYHHNFIKTKQSDYPLLRQGLEEYFNEFHSYAIFLDLEIKNKVWDVLDYGAGGTYMRQAFMTVNPNSTYLTLDRENASLNIDFELTPDWDKEYNDCFDLVIMSELLHCKNKFWQLYLIISAYDILKLGGKLLIIENEDLCMEYRMNKLKGTNELNVLTEWHIRELIGCRKFDLKSITEISPTHKAYIYEKF